MSLNKFHNSVTEIRTFTLLISLTFALLTLTFKEFFFLDPFSGVTGFVSFQRLLFDFGWVSFIFITPLTQVLTVREELRNNLFLASWIWWPASLILIHASSWVTAGDPYLGYLINYPVFILTDVIAPVAYSMIWLVRRKSLNS